MNWDNIYEKFFPKISMKNGLFATIVSIMKYVFLNFNDYIDENINKDI